MVLVLLLVVIAVLFGVGFAVHLLWWVALAAVLLWLVTFFVGRGDRRGFSRRRL